MRRLLLDAAVLERAVQMNPFHAPSLARLAILYASTGEQTELALTLARRAAAASPDDSFAYIAQGVAAKQNGLTIEARAALETSLRLAPGYQLAQTELEEVKRIQQYPMSGAWTSEAGLWLQIDVDGTTLRCRLTRSGAARQTGTLAGSVITWTTPTADDTGVESRDNVELAGGRLRLENEQGEILLWRVDAMPGACDPLFN